MSLTINFVMTHQLRVLVSANIDETLSLTISCNCFRRLDLRPNNRRNHNCYIHTMGNITSPNSFMKPAHQLTVSTNADSGYTVKAEENDQMEEDGGVCPGAGTGVTDNCIQDTPCDGLVCTESTSQDWTDSINYRGFGYSSPTLMGADAAFTYNESARTFSTKQFPDQEALKLCKPL